MSICHRAPIALLALFVMVLAPSLIRAQSSGWKIATIDTVLERLTLIDVTADSLRYEQKGDIVGLKTRGAIALDDILEVRRGHVSGALIGAGIGVGFGLVGYVVGGNSYPSGGYLFTQGQRNLMLGGLIAGVGAIIGAIADPGDEVVVFTTEGRPQRRAALARIVMFDTP